MMMFPLLLAASSPASGQTLRGAAGAALIVSPFSPESLSGEPGLTFHNTSTESVALGVTADIAWLLSPFLAVGGEVGIPFRQELLQTHDYFNPYRLVSEYRDLTLFAVVRAPLYQAGRIGVEVMAGGGAVQQSSLEKVAEGRFGSSVFGPFGNQKETVRWTWGLTGGVDVSFRVTPRLAIVPQFRVLAIDRGNILDSSGFSFGFGKAGYRYGAGVRTAF